MTEKTNVLLYCISLGNGGAERQVVNLANNLDKTKFSVTIYMRDYDVAYQSYLDDDVKVAYYRSLEKRRSHDNPFCLLHQVFSLGRFIRRGRFDVVYARTYVCYNRAFLAWLFLNRSFKLVCSEASTPSCRSVRLGPTLISGFALRWSDSVFALTDANRQDMIKHYALKRSVRVFPVVLDVDEIERKASEHDASLPETSYNVIAVGRFFEPKGHLFLIDSFSRAWSEGMVLSLFGRGEMESVYRARIAQANMEESIKIGGFKENPYSVMGHADLLVFTSRYEGFGNALLEAIVCGVPVLSTDFHGMDRDLRDKLREAGSLVTYGNVKELAGAIMRSRANPVDRRKVAAGLKEFVVRQFGAKQKVGELSDHFMRIAGKRILLDGSSSYGA